MAANARAVEHVYKLEGNLANGFDGWMHTEIIKDECNLHNSPSFL